LRKYKILYADDHEANRLLIKTFLAKANCDLDLADDGEEAIEAEARNQYDLVILDISMPRKTGIEAARSIREREKNEGSNSKPILTLTALSDDNTREECKQAGVDHFLTKPATKNILMENLRRFLPDL
jgi:CheY-like chemotaxis protein